MPVIRREKPILKPTAVSMTRIMKGKEFVTFLQQLKVFFNIIQINYNINYFIINITAFGIRCNIFNKPFLVDTIRREELLKIFLKRTRILKA